MWVIVIYKYNNNSINSNVNFLSKNSCWYYHYAPCELFTRMLADGLSLRFKWEQSFYMSRTLFDILADLNNAVFRMILIHPPISNSSSPLSKPLETVPSTPIINSITITFMFHSFLSSLARSVSLLLCDPLGRQSSRYGKFTFSFFFFFFFFVNYHEIRFSGWD